MATIRKHATITSGGNARHPSRIRLPQYGSIWPYSLVVGYYLHSVLLNRDRSMGVRPYSPESPTGCFIWDKPRPLVSTAKEPAIATAVLRYLWRSYVSDTLSVRMTGLAVPIVVGVLLPERISSKSAEKAATPSNMISGSLPHRKL